MEQADTKTRLLNAAERLFSQQGFANTTMRAITSLAEANLAAVNYHFGSKEDLLQAVLERRLLPLNQLRRERIEQTLADARESGRLPRVEALLRAFIEPTMAFRCQQSGSRDFVTLIGRALNSADLAVRERFLALVRPLFESWHQALCLALPQHPPELILTRLFFAMGAIGHCLCFGGLDQFPHLTACDEGEEDVLCEQLITFVTAGLEAPC